MFSTEQEEMLSAKLNKAVVKKHPHSGCDYIEGWHAIAEANRIFGYGCWSRETVYLAPVSDPVKNAKGTLGITYLAKVRVTVNTGNGEIVREGTGTGSGWSNNIGDAHDSASKTAETDAMKRALMTFGNPFGLALYDDDKKNVGKPELTKEERAAVALKSFNSIKASINSFSDLGQLEEYWAGKKIAEYIKSLMAFDMDDSTMDDSTMGDILTKEYLARKAALSEPEEQNILNAG